MIRYTTREPRLTFIQPFLRSTCLRGRVPMGREESTLALGVLRSEYKAKLANNEPAYFGEELRSFIVSTFFEELKRRKVYRVAVAYAVVAGGIIQLASAVFPAWELRSCVA